MIEFELKTKGFNEALRNLANYETIATEENRQAMNKSVKIVERAAKENAPVGAVGELRAKITGEVRSFGPGEVVGVVGSYAIHGAVVEEGADPHWPNVEGLKLWVVRVLRLKDKAADSATFLIGRIISRRGLKARPYLEPAIDDSQGEIRGFFERALDNIVRRLAE